MKKLMIIIWCSLFALIGFSQDNQTIGSIKGDVNITDGTNIVLESLNDNDNVITINESGTSSWGYITLSSEIVSEGTYYEFQAGDCVKMSNDGNLYTFEIDFSCLLDKGWMTIGSGLNMESKLLISNIIPQLISYSLDTVPVLDSVIYEKIAGDWYRRDYTSEYIILYTMPEDSTTLDADSIRLQLVVDSLDREMDVAGRRINRMRDRITFEYERVRQLRNELQDAKLKLKELLKIRRRYYRRL